MIVGSRAPALRSHAWRSPAPGRVRRRYRRRNSHRSARDGTDAACAELLGDLGDSIGRTPPRKRDRPSAREYRRRTWVPPSQMSNAVWATYCRGDGYGHRALDDGAQQPWPVLRDGTPSRAVATAPGAELRSRGERCWRSRRTHSARRRCALRIPAGSVRSESSAGRSGEAGRSCHSASKRRTDPMLRSGSRAAHWRRAASKSGPSSAFNRCQDGSGIRRVGGIGRPRHAGLGARLHQELGRLAIFGDGARGVAADILVAGLGQRHAAGTDLEIVDVLGEADEAGIGQGRPPHGPATCRRPAWRPARRALSGGG